MMFCTVTTSLIPHGYTSSWKNNTLHNNFLLIILSFYSLLLAFKSHCPLWLQFLTFAPSWWVIHCSHYLSPSYNYKLLCWHRLKLSVYTTDLQPLLSHLLWTQHCLFAALTHYFKPLNVSWISPWCQITQVVTKGPRGRIRCAHCVYSRLAACSSLQGAAGEEGKLTDIITS